MNGWNLQEGAKRLAATISEREAHGITVLFNNAGLFATTNNLFRTP